MRGAHLALTILTRNFVDLLRALAEERLTEPMREADHNIPAISDRLNGRQGQL
jgi:hypothetical protein